MGKDYGCRATKFSARQVLTNAEFRNFVGDELAPWPGCQADLEWQTLNGSLPLTLHGTPLMSPIVSIDTHLVRIRVIT